MTGDFTTGSIIRLPSGRVWFVKHAAGPEAERCVENAVTHAIVTGSVGATFEIGGDSEESRGEVVELVERQPGSKDLYRPPTVAG